MPATLQTGGSRPVIRLERALPYSAAEVWRLLTTPQGLAGWFPQEIVVAEWTPGTSLTFRSQMVEAFGGLVIEVEPPRRLVYTWGTDTLRFEVEAGPGEHTRLVLEDELEPETAARTAAGWDVCLDRLAGLNPASDAWRAHFTGTVAVFEPVLGSQIGPPAG